MSTDLANIAAATTQIPETPFVPLVSVSLGQSSRAGATLGAVSDDQTPFEREKAAFNRKRHSLRHLAGQYVAIHDGRVAASDPSRNGVLRKFFAEYPPGTSVYIGFIGRRPVARVRPAFFVRRVD